MNSIIVTTLLAATAMAAPEFNKDSDTPPLCKFDPAKGEYVCPAGVHMPSVSKLLTDTSGYDIKVARVSTMPTSKDSFAAFDASAADCPKCQRDWEACISCKECPAGQCHA
ncbi:hypothetical protein N0V86_001834 [Didymella sp. IMI 355093]|nr:hypothetical protein N0V86_001834 [Didymella sp. IMI 355093]